MILLVQRKRTWVLIDWLTSIMPGLFLGCSRQRDWTSCRLPWGSMRRGELARLRHKQYSRRQALDCMAYPVSMITTDLSVGCCYQSLTFIILIYCIYIVGEKPSMHASFCHCVSAVSMACALFLGSCGVPLVVSSESPEVGARTWS